jgi:hypothetical protein
MSDRNEPSGGERAGHSLTAWARRRYGRRALFIGAAAASAGLAADMVAGSAAEAAPDAAKPVLLGKQNVTSGATSVGSTNSNGIEGRRCGSYVGPTLLRGTMLWRNAKRTAAPRVEQPILASRHRGLTRAKTGLWSLGERAPQYFS